MGLPLEIEQPAGSPLPLGYSQSATLTAPRMTDAFIVREAPCPDARESVTRSVVPTPIVHDAASVRRRRHLTPKTDLSIVVYPNDELPAFEVVTSPEIQRRRARLMPKTDISIAVYTDTDLAAIEVISSPEPSLTVVPPPVLPATPSKYLNGEVELDIGMAPYSAWNGGKKARYVVS